VHLFVSGAGGFIGSAVVDAAVSRGHRVTALHRRPPTRPTGGAPGTTSGAEPPVRIVVGDLADPALPWRAELAVCDAVLHLAGSFGTEAEQQRATVDGTRNLLAAMATEGVDRLVLVGSIAVYDYAALAPNALLDEGCPLESRPERRDPYTRAKLAQERLVADAAGVRACVLRPGAVYGPGRLWDGGLAFRPPFGPGLVVGAGSRLKLVYVEHCAEAVVLAAERPDAVGTVLDLVDDDLPTAAGFAAALGRHGFATPRGIPVPYRVARLAHGVDRAVLGGRLPLPELLVPERLAARYKPLRYTNAEARRVLAWAPRWSLDEALARTAAASTGRPG
jgi:nucleoside-diphosphate-sugar epimerase